MTWRQLMASGRVRVSMRRGDELAVAGRAK